MGDHSKRRLLDFAWSEWTQMGLLASAPHRSPWAEDPEALIVFTLEVARDAPRLFDELLDWLLRNEPLVIGADRHHGLGLMPPCARTRRG